MNTIESWALHAYADGELDASGRAEIEAMLEHDPKARAELQTWQSQRAALKSVFDGILDEPLPPQLVRALDNRPKDFRRSLPALAASVALLLTGALAGWLFARTVPVSDESVFAGRALAAHGIYSAEVRHPVEVAAVEKDHLQKWLSKRVGVPFVIPDLNDKGYALLGGRLLVIEDRPAAQIMYEDASKRRITLYLRSYADDQEQSVRIENRGKLIACYWREGKLGLVVAGEMDKAEMTTLAQAIYDKFETGP